MLKIPPTHTIDGNAVYIYSLDPAWDFDKIGEERAARTPSAQRGPPTGTTEDGRPFWDTSTEEHAPVARYFAGKTRYQLDAPARLADGTPCTVRHFLKGKPAEFGLRRLSLRDFTEVADIESTRARLVEACRRGLRAFNSEGFTWYNGQGIGSDGKEGPVSCEQAREMLHATDPGLVIEIGAAVMNLCRPLDPETETPR